MRALGGVIPAALTMFDRRGRLDDDATSAHMHWLIGQGIHGLVVGGTSGEFIALSERERRRLVAIAVEAVAGRVPLIYGTGAFATDATVALTRHAAKSGADAAIVILPYYQRPSVAEVVQHFVTVSARTDLPVIVYNNPTNSAAPPLAVHDLIRLHAMGAAVGVKSTFPTVHQIHELRSELPEDFRVLYGSFMAPLEGLAGGAHGWISGILNVVAADAVALWRAIGMSDLGEARTAWSRILPIKRLYTDARLGGASDLVIYRALLELRGVHGGWSRQPLQPLSHAARELLERMATEGLLPVGSSVVPR